MLTDTLSQVPAPQASPVDTLTLNLVILLTSLALYCGVDGLPGWVTLPQAGPAHHARLRGNVFAATEFLFGFIATRNSTTRTRAVRSWAETLKPGVTMSGAWDRGVTRIPGASSRWNWAAEYSY